MLTQPHPTSSLPLPPGTTGSQATEKMRLFHGLLPEQRSTARDLPNATAPCGQLVSQKQYHPLMRITHLGSTHPQSLAPTKWLSDLETICISLRKQGVKDLPWNQHGPRGPSHFSKLLPACPLLSLESVELQTKHRTT